MTASPSFPGSPRRRSAPELERFNSRNRARSLDPPDVQAVALVLDCEQASHNGDISRAVEAGALNREDVTELGRILLGEAPGRRAAEEITVLDSTGLAVQDLAVAALVYERWRAGGDGAAFAGVVAIDLH